ncbi:hypothetical protein [Marinospirillum sp.]|uniref:hypothetical protein n=1 Tax=Marinospirillum sp. TaxID=2183934 RepID=UPI00385065E2
MMDYLSDEFMAELQQKTFCGPNAWKRLMSWLHVDPAFQEFMQVWQAQIAPTFHTYPAPTELPDISGLLETHFEALYPAQFILRLAQLVDVPRKNWLFTALNEKQQEVLFAWLRDSQLDRDKGFLADHWTSTLNQEQLCYKGIPLYASLTYEVFKELAAISNPQVKRFR